MVLPDRSLSRGKFLMPIPKWQWREPSVALPRDQFWNKTVQTRFRLTAKLSDNYTAWTGWFDDRDDADAFLFALIYGSLRYERELWRLPTTNWHPGIGDNLVYDFATVTFLTSTSSSTYTLPSDWNNSNNTIECIGGGGSGGASNRSTSVASCAAGGGGGGYGKYTNLILSTNATYKCGIGGSSVNRTTVGATSGNAGTETWFNGADYATASVGGSFGSGGAALSSGSSGTANGGAGGGGKGTSSFTGGRGGNAGATGTQRVGSGAGGAAGLNGNGNNGVDISATTGTASNGGSGDAGFGGAGGVVGGTITGGNGTEWSASYGSGGGGAGAETGTASATAGSGGDYGGGGGGVGGGTTTAASSSVTSGSGKQGLVVVTYTPGIFLANINLAMIGM